MAFCGQCGTQIQDDARFCPVCGTVQGQQAAVQSAPPEQSQQGSYQQYQQASQQPYQQPYQQPVQPERTYEADGDPHTLAVGAISVLSYAGILFFVPLVAAKDSRFARFHSSQGLNLFLSWLIVVFGGMILVSLFAMIAPVLAGIVGFLMFAGYIFLLVLLIIGIVNVCKGEMKPLPVIGNIKILKM
jgi:uncharacterized membrane protein